MDGINLQRAQLETHSFYFVLAASKACLFPFLTVYFRGLGLSALQTGLVISVKAWLFMLFAPLWTKCAFRCNRKKVFFMFSLFMLLASHLLLALVPSSSPQMAQQFCQNELSYHSNMSVEVGLNKTEGGLPGALNETVMVTTGSIPTTSTTFRSTSSLSTVTSTVMSFKALTPGHSSTGGSTHMTSTMTTVSGNSNTVDMDELMNTLTELMLNAGYTQEEIDEMSEDEFQQAAIDVMEQVGLDSSQFLTDTRHRRSVHGQSHQAGPGLMEKIVKLRKHMDSLAQQAFVAVMLVVTVGEVFSAPHAKLADDLWFEFLDNLDVLEKYGKHVPWTALGYMLPPLLVTYLVSISPCLLSYDIHHFMIHFYSFAAACGLCLVLAFFYPTVQLGRKIKRKNHLLKGLKVLFGDIHSGSLTITVFLMGFLHAPLSNYCFWMVQDKGGSEVVMGGAVAASALGDLLLYFTQKCFLHKISVGIAVIICIMTLAFRLFIYGFMWTAWLVIPGDFLHCLSYTLLWGAIHSYPDFKMNPFAMDRSAQTVLQATHHGLGFAIGSLVAGLLYDVTGVRALFLGASLIAVVWCAMFALVQRCCQRRDKLKYARLLQGEEEEAEYSDAGSHDDDWLEVAMKDDTWK